jgi:hypothetical protein
MGKNKIVWATIILRILCALAWDTPRDLQFWGLFEEYLITVAWHRNCAAIPAGVRGRAALLSYFTKLLGRNPNWVWTHRGSIPIQDGFLNRWYAFIPVGSRTVEVEGVCTVQLRDGLIYSNEVFFDRTELLRAIEALRRDG